MKYGIIEKLFKSKVADNQIDFQTLGFDPVFYLESNPDLLHLASPK